MIQLVYFRVFFYFDSQNRKENGRKHWRRVHPY